MKNDYLFRHDEFRVLVDDIFRHHFIQFRIRSRFDRVVKFKCFLSAVPACLCALVLSDGTANDEKFI